MMKMIFFLFFDGSDQNTNDSGISKHQHAKLICKTQRRRTPNATKIKRLAACKVNTRRTTQRGERTIEN